MQLHFSKSSSFSSHVQQHAAAAMMDLQKCYDAVAVTAYE